MILGIGIDTIEIARVLRACERSSHFVERTFTTKEMAQFAEHKVRKASDFAAKEAVAKAFRTGFYQCEPRELRCSGENWRNRMCGCMERQKR
ncbi:MAG: 4'-phosphopantetheinyl transferase superfamily protein [Eubacterium sp.]